MSFQYLQVLLIEMLIRFNVKSDRFKLITYINFVNVAHDITESVKEDSNNNEVKVKIINAMIKKLLARN